MHRHIRHFVLALVVVSGAAQSQSPSRPEATPAQASGACSMNPQDALRDDLPAVQELGAVRVLTGGIGVSEARAMRAVQSRYPLALTFVQQFGDKHRFMANVRVDVRHADGTPVLCATSDGPYMFLDLPPGEYHVSATTDGGRMLARWATLAAGSHRDITFVWPASAGAH